MFDIKTAWERILSEEPCWIIWSNEHSAWWRAERCGYTTDEASAGHYTLAEAIDICDVRSNGPIPPECMKLAPEFRESWWENRDRTPVRKETDA